LPIEIAAIIAAIEIGSIVVPILAATTVSVSRARSEYTIKAAPLQISAGTRTIIITRSAAGASLKEITPSALAKTSTRSTVPSTSAFKTPASPSRKTSASVVHAAAAMSHRFSDNPRRSTRRNQGSRRRTVVVKT
jgi:hypothetical protein